MSQMINIGEHQLKDLINIFNIGKILVNISIIKSIAIIKRSAAIVHNKDELIDKQNI